MLKLSEINIDKISEDSLFPSRFGGDDRNLKTSMQAYGLLTPPSVFKTKSGYQIIDGSRRVAISREIGLKTIPCFIYDEKTHTQKSLFLLCIELNAWDREFNLVEKALLIKTAHDVYKGHAIPKIFWSAVKVPQNIRAIQLHKDILRLPLNVQKYAVNNNIPLTVILGFLKFPAGQVEKLANQLFVLPLNQNKLAEILGLLADICKREDKLVLAILDEAMAELKSGMRGQQIEQKFRALLNKRRNPIYEGRLREFEDKIKKLPLGKSTTILPAPFFEDDYVEVQTRISNMDELQALQNLLEDKHWKDLIRD